MALAERIKHGWNAFINNKNPTVPMNIGPGYYYRPDRPRFTRGNERSIITSIFNRIAIDCADIDIKHVILDSNGRFMKEKDSGLNKCFNLEANIDQTGKEFIKDIVISMFDEGVVALVPVDTVSEPNEKGAFDIESIRVGKIIEWYPQHVKVEVYNEMTGRKEDIIMHKRNVGIIENPFFSVVNEPNSTLQRLIRKLNLLDFIDEQSTSGKLDLIIQLPYVVRNTTRKNEAKDRLDSITQQLSGSKYGIAYIDATEKVTQLNRPVENNLMKTIEYLTSMLYSQLGIDQTILSGTADEKTKLSYYNTTILPIVSAIVNECRRKFLTKTARSQNQTIMYFKDPFKLVPVNEIAEIADKFTRNEIASSNEIRQVIGWTPSNDPKADMLVNSNIAQPNQGQPQDYQNYEEEEEIQNE